MRFRNAFGGSLAFAALIFALAASPQLLDAAQEHEGQAAALEETISVLRAEGDYEGALEAAEELLRLLADDAATTPYDLDTVGRDVETLRHISSLPEDDRSELARADSLSIEIWGVSAEGRYAEAATSSRPCSSTAATSTRRSPCSAKPWRSGARSWANDTPRSAAARTTWRYSCRPRATSQGPSYCFATRSGSSTRSSAPTTRWSPH